MAVLDFEKRIEELKEQIDVAKIKGDSHAVSTLEKELKKEVEKTFKNLTPYQKLQLARHPDRPHAIDFIDLIMDEKVELHGDREFRDDSSIVCFIGMIDNQKCVVIGEEKGRNTKEKLQRNFGMPHPEGYRKALRVAKLAEKFDLPILFLVDTPGAFPGLEAEERGQGEAIARNILEMTKLEVPIIVVIIGEGASGGALGIGVGDKILMLNNAWYSVISPENCSTILWKSWDYKEIAADALKLTATDMKGLGLVDEIIKEPLGGAHTFPEETYKKVKKSITKAIQEFSSLDKETLVNNRIEKFCNMGMVKE